MIFQKTAGSKKALLLLLVLALGSSSVFAEQEAPELIPTIQPSDLNLEEIEPELPLWRKIVHWYFAAGAMMELVAAHGYRELYPAQAAQKLFGAHDTLSPEIKAIANDVIRQQGTDPDTIKLLNARTQNIGIAVGNNTMVLDEQTFTEYTPEEIQFIVGHELAHLKNRDILKMGIVAFAAPFIAHFGLKAWDSGVKSALTGIKHTLGVTKNSRTDTVLTKIKDINHWLSTFCITKAAVAWQLFCAYSRYCEKQADLAAVQHLNSSEGAERFFKRAQELMKSQRDTNFATKLVITPEGDNRADVLHPRISERIAYTQEYAQTL